MKYPKPVDGAAEYRHEDGTAVMPEAQPSAPTVNDVIPLSPPQPPGSSQFLAAFNAKDKPGKYLYWCPGCKSHHVINSTWRIESWSPLVVSPSVLVTAPPSSYRCHHFIKGDKIQFLDDCSHDLRGKTVMMELPHTGETGNLS